MDATKKIGRAMDKTARAIKRGTKKLTRAVGIGKKSSRGSKSRSGRSSTRNSSGKRVTGKRR
jgi:hypothetical protein